MAERPQFNLLTEERLSDPPEDFGYCKCGPKNIPAGVSDPADIFLLFWGPIFEDIVRAINTELANNFKWTGKARKAPFIVTSEILLAWLGCWIELGLHPTYTLKDAFARVEGNDFLQEYFCRDEFLAIFGALWHIKHEIFILIEERLNEAFPKYWTAFRETAIDEGMALFKGHWGNKVYSPDKPTRFGLKYYLLVDCAQYLIQFKLYRKTTKTSMRDLINNFVDKLPKDNGQYYIYADNYYGGLDVAADLATKGLKFTFTCRANRPSDLFKNFLHKNMKKDDDLGNVAFAISDDEKLAACSWKDKSLVNFISNIHYNETVKMMRKKNNKWSLITAPRVAQDYTASMGQVDVFDSIVARYRAKHKNKSWKRCHFLQLFHYSLVNSFHIFRMITSNQDLVYKKFLQQARQSFVSKYKNILDVAEQRRVEKMKDQARIRQQLFRERKQKEKDMSGAEALLELNNL